MFYSYTLPWLSGTFFCYDHMRIHKRLPLHEFSLEFVVWFVPSLIGNAVAVSITGLLLGPMFPIVMNQSSRILPPWILTGAVGWIAGFGSAGSALLPFLTGAIADKHGIQSLHPLYVTSPIFDFYWLTADFDSLVAMMAVMVLLFWLTPSTPPAITDRSPPSESNLEKEIR